MATMRQVAERAGVSISTVSFIVNNTKPVTEETRARVEAAMDELGFRRNVLARALATQRTRIFAIAFPSEQHRLGPTALSIITAAAATAADRGHSVVLWPVGYEDGRLDEYARSGLVDGVLLMEVRADDPRIGVLERLGIPFGLIGRRSAEEALPFVDLDFEMAVEDGISHLRGLGHRDIGLVVGEIADPDYGGYGPVMRTREAFTRRMGELGLPAVVVESPHSPLGGVSAAEALVRDHPGVTGVLVLNEAALFGFLNGIARSGYRVPQDLSIVGLATSADNVAIADPVLSTIAAPGSEVGVIAANGMIDALEGGTTETTRALVRCVLQPGGSTMPPREAGPTDSLPR